MVISLVNWVLSGSNFAVGSTVVISLLGSFMLSRGMSSVVTMVSIWVLG